ncbi:hypothetical protein vseg_020172 [Gypsophila vaccaria]
MAYGSNYYEADREVVRTTAPYPGYVDPVYPRHHHNGTTTVVTEVVAAESIPGAGYGYGHRHHHHRPAGATQIVEREERIVENVPYGSYGTPMY